MTRVSKPRFHDEESFGSAEPHSFDTSENGKDDPSSSPRSDYDGLIQSARLHLSNKDVKAGVDDIILAYETLAKEKAKLTALRNEAFRDLSTVKGWQGAPHPEALRLKRATPSIPLNTRR